jgi:predicted dehydrogenase
MEDSQPVRLAIVGVGNIGRAHARYIAALPQADLVAVCDIDRALADACAQEFGAAAYYAFPDLLQNASFDGLVIATPHNDHVQMTIDAFARGLHVLVEKPIAVHVKNARRMIAAYESARAARPDLVFAAMFMQRTYGFWRKIKDLIDSGELGQLVRTTWIITNWFRTQRYYDSGGWRATWRGEGGGVLLNQAPHNLDLYQWLVGMPEKVAGFASLGKYHDIEVEDEVTACFEHANGMVGHFITSTGESPGTNRLEIVGENGRLVFEEDRLTFWRNRFSMLRQIRESDQSFAKVEYWPCDIPYEHHGQGGHDLVIANFADAILRGETLIAPAPEGLNSVALANAILLSALEGRPVTLPFDEDLYEQKLLEMAATSRYVKPEADPSGSPTADFSQSFN